MDWIIKLAGLFGFVKKARVAIQGKKTYLVNSIQVVGALGGLLVALTVGLKALSDILTAVLQFSDGTISVEQLQATVTLITKDHAVVLGGIVAAWYVLLDALQNMTKYASDRRAEQKRDAMMVELKTKGLLPEVPPCPPGFEPTQPDDGK